MVKRKMKTQRLKAAREMIECLFPDSHSFSKRYVLKTLEMAEEGKGIKELKQKIAEKRRHLADATKYGGDELFWPVGLYVDDLLGEIESLEEEVKG